MIQPKVTGIAGETLIKASENCELKAYNKDGNWTIGYGNIFMLGRRVIEGDSITLPFALTLFEEGLREREKELAALLDKDLNQNQWDATMDLFWEIGSGNFEISTLRKKINLDPSDLTIATEFKKWVYGHDDHGKLVQLPGMITRRGKEIALYYSTTETI